MRKLSVLGAIAVSAVFCAAPVSVQWSQHEGVTVTTDAAQARIGRPLTPMSVAGVHRRAVRRSYYGAYAYGYRPYPYRPYAYPYYRRY